MRIAIINNITPKILVKIAIGSLWEKYAPSCAQRGLVRTIPKKAGKYIYPKLQGGKPMAYWPVNTKLIAPIIAIVRLQETETATMSRIGTLQ